MSLTAFLAFFVAAETEGFTRGGNLDLFFLLSGNCLLLDGDGSTSAAAAAKTSKQRGDLLGEGLLFLLVALVGVLGCLLVFVLAMISDGVVMELRVIMLSVYVDVVASRFALRAVEQDSNGTLLSVRS